MLEPAPLASWYGIEVAAPASAERADFVAFYDDQVRLLVGYVCAVTGARVPEARDAAETALADAWRNWPTIRHPKAWVRKAAIGAYFRRPVDAKRRADLEEAEEVADPSSVEQDYVELTRAMELQQQLLSTLSITLRHPFVLYLEGYSVAEIADHVNRTPDAVYKNIQRAREALRPAIEKAQRRGGE